MRLRRLRRMRFGRSLHVLLVHGVLIRPLHGSHVMTSVSGRRRRAHPGHMVVSSRVLTGRIRRGVALVAARRRDAMTRMHSSVT
jgi:hypothetical protein